MDGKVRLKIGIDILMMLLLPVLMAFQITGRELHEWFGTGMFMLFLVHNILNFKWYKKLFKGKYTFLRTLQAVVTISILAASLCLAYSGIIMSGYVFPYVLIKGQMALARQIHMVASYWVFILMSVHIGFHWCIAVGMAGKKFRNRKLSKQVLYVLRIAAAAIAGYGAVCFYRADIASYLFLKVQFVFFDFGRSGVSVVAEYTAIMGFLIFLVYYFVKGLNKISLVKGKEETS